MMMTTTTTRRQRKGAFVCRLKGESHMLNVKWKCRRKGWARRVKAVVVCTFPHQHFVYTFGGASLLTFFQSWRGIKKIKRDLKKTHTRRVRLFGVAGRSIQTMRVWKKGTHQTPFFFIHGHIFFIGFVPLFLVATGRMTKIPCVKEGGKPNNKKRNGGGCCWAWQTRPSWASRRKRSELYLIFFFILDD